MTRKEAWVRFMAGALADGMVSAETAVKRADKALAELDARWPEEKPAPPRNPRPGRGEDGGEG